MLSVITQKQVARFHSYLKQEGECLVWTRSCMRDGYGTFSIGAYRLGTSRTVLTHRLAWLLAHPSDNLESKDYVLHRCDNPPCCRIDHLFRGTQLDNMRDMAAKGRASRSPKNRGSTHGNSKLTKENVREILASNEFHRVLAVRFGVARATISRIKKGASWAWLDKAENTAPARPSGSASSDTQDT